VWFSDLAEPFRQRVRLLGHTREVLVVDLLLRFLVFAEPLSHLAGFFRDHRHLRTGRNLQFRLLFAQALHHLAVGLQRAGKGGRDLPGFGEGFVVDTGGFAQPGAGFFQCVGGLDGFPGYVLLRSSAARFVDCSVSSIRPIALLQRDQPAGLFVQFRMFSRTGCQPAEEPVGRMRIPSSWVLTLMVAEVTRPSDHTPGSPGSDGR
jgi:hypothetical protein